ncbi:MAG: hypothetical protein ACRENC_00905 [Gemmatimonadaceae bacterium]
MTRHDAARNGASLGRILGRAVAGPIATAPAQAVRSFTDEDLLSRTLAYAPRDAESAAVYLRTSPDVVERARRSPLSLPLSARFALCDHVEQYQGAVPLARELRRRTNERIAATWSRSAAFPAGSRR